MELLFTLAHWHALAKLRQHTDFSLSILESVTAQLGRLLRDFKAKVCDVYDTRELERETAARMRRMAGKVKASATVTGRGESSKSSGYSKFESYVNSRFITLCITDSLLDDKVATGKQQKLLNLNTYKDHALGDYVETIRQYGTVDSYSTESVNQFYCIYISSSINWGAYCLDGIGTQISKVPLPEDKPKKL